MLKKIFIYFSIFIILLFGTNSFCFGIFIPNVYQSDDKKILAFSELNAATLTLPSGQKIQSTNINGDTNMTITTITSPIELVLVIDISGSMSGDNLNSTKQAACTLIENLFSVANKIQVSLITFESNSNLLITSSDKNLILSKIQSLSAGGGTDMSPALDMAQNIFNQMVKDPNNNTYPYLIVLTDGATSNASTCYQKLLNLQNSQITIYDILVSGATKEAFSQNNVDAGIIYENVSNAEIQAIYDEIYFQICSDFIDNDVSDFIEDAQHYFIANDNMYIFLDSELTQGTTLTLEYLINIKSAINCTELTLQNEVDAKLGFNPSAKLISEDATNSNYGWEINEDISYTSTDTINHNLVLTIHETSNNNNYVISRGETYQCKLVLTCLLDTKDDTNYSNSLTFRIKGVQPTSQGSQEVIYLHSLDSMETNILPPFGKNNNNSIFIICIVVLCFLVLCIYINLLKRANRN